MSGAASGAALGGKQSSSSSATENITNTDKRIAAQDALILQDIGNFSGSINYNSTDAAVAMANLTGYTVGAVTDLTAYSIDRNLDSIDSVQKQSIQLVDSLIEQSYAAAQESQAAAYAANASAQATASQAIAKAQETSAKITGDAFGGAREVIAQQLSLVGSMAKQNADLGSSLSKAAIAAYTPGENKGLESVKALGIAAAVALAAVFIFKGKA